MLTCRWFELLRLPYTKARSKASGCDHSDVQPELPNMAMQTARRIRQAAGVDAGIRLELTYMRQSLRTTQMQMLRTLHGSELRSGASADVYPALGMG